MRRGATRADYTAVEWKRVKLNRAQLSLHTCGDSAPLGYVSRVAGRSQFHTKLKRKKEILLILRWIPACVHTLDSVRPTHTHLSRCVGLRIFQSRASRANNITRQCLISFWAFWKSRSFVFKRRVVFIVYLGWWMWRTLIQRGTHTQKREFPAAIL
jgi:hypothetical protein